MRLIAPTVKNLCEQPPTVSSHNDKNFNKTREMQFLTQMHQKLFGSCVPPRPAGEAYSVSSDGDPVAGFKVLEACEFYLYPTVITALIHLIKAELIR